MRNIKKAIEKLNINMMYPPKKNFLKKAGDIFYDNGRYAEASAMYEKCFSPEAMFNFGICLFFLGELEEALRALILSQEIHELGSVNGYQAGLEMIWVELLLVSEDGDEEKLKNFCERSEEFLKVNLSFPEFFEAWGKSNLFPRLKIFCGNLPARDEFPFYFDDFLKAVEWAETCHRKTGRPQP